MHDGQLPSTQLSGLVIKFTSSNVHSLVSTLKLNILGFLFGVNMYMISPSGGIYALALLTSSSVQSVVKTSSEVEIGGFLNSTLRTNTYGVAYSVGSPGITLSSYIPPTATIDRYMVGF